tara:strand:- start:357 stop:596 length:240 start_codon:yes stop_codon:yes gene_type:complete
MGSWFARVILNSLGASVRWLWGSIWRTIFKKPKYNWNDYLYGPENSDYYDNMGHSFNNGLIGVIVLIFVIIPIVELIFD